MREEIRLVIAFAFAIAIILIFGKMQSKQAPQTVKPEEPPAVTAEKETPETGEKPFSFKPASETESGEEKIYENGRFIIKLDTAGGMIKKIGLKEYTRKDETSIPVLESSDLLLNYVEGFEESASAVYEFQKTGELLVFQNYSQNLLTEKAITIPTDSYTFKSEIAVYNKSADTAVIKNYAVSAGKIDLSPLKTRGRQFIPPEIIIDTGGKTATMNAARIKASSLYENTNWIAVKQNYGLVFLRAGKAAKSFVSPEDGHIKIGFIYENIEIKPGEREKLEFAFYAGPADYFIASKEIGEKQVFGTSVFAAMGRFLFAALYQIHRVIPNWGWTIILLTLIIKIVFFPLTMKSLRSMKAMQKLRPYMQDLQKKYKGNPQQMQKELMNLYREYKINPMGGCLPMLVQFPIFIGFFIALRNSVFLRGAPFMLWIKDLSLPDTIANIGGFNLNLLPIIMAATSFWQQKLTPQEPSQKALTYMMPIMFLFLFYNFSAGLLLYWTTMNMAGLVEQYFVHKR